jgi:geranylgeranyl diphosphate synthase, type I
MLMKDVVQDAEREAEDAFRDDDLPLYDVVRYHLGWVDESFQPADADPGKQIRPAICLLCTEAAGGRPDVAVPVAAAIELLHNFTLIHDDVQDRSEYRRGRRTVWRNWGISQAINAGDAAFALSQLALLRLSDHDIDSKVIVDLVAAFNRVTLEIVEGQVLDLGFERRWDIRADDYTRMISGKTAAIVAFAARSGAVVAGCDASVADRFHMFGSLLGLGFQMRDDYLGIWGDRSSTGKEPGDDIRGRKRSIPIVMLLDSLSEHQLATLRQVYNQPELSPHDVETVTEMLDEHRVSERVQSMTARYHDQALELLDSIAEGSPAKDQLASLAERLVDRAR